MTDTNDKLRSLFLVAIMVLSVFATTVAFVGTAAASNHQVGVDSAVEYNDGYAEIVLNNTLADTSEGPVSVDVYVDGESTDWSATSLSVSNRDSVGVVEFQIQNDGDDTDITPNENLTVHVNDLDTGGPVQSVQATDIDVTATHVDATSDSGSYTPESNVFQGETIAIEASGPSADIEIDAEDGGLVASDNTGDGSLIYLQDTDDLDTGETYNVNASAEDASFTVNDLGLDFEDHTSDVYTQENITADLSITRGGELVNGTLYYADDVDDFDNRSIEQDLSSNSDTEFDFGPIPEDGETGEYRINVTDLQTDVSEEVTVNVSESPDAEVEFDSSIVSQENGDIANITLHFSDNTDEGTLVIGNQNDFGYMMQANITADDEGDTVSLEFNSSDAQMSDEPLSVADDEDAEINDQNEYGQAEGVLEAAQYDMNVSSGHFGNVTHDQRVDSDVATLSLNQRSTNGVTTLVSPDQVDDEVWANMDSSVTESDEVAIGGNSGTTDYAIFEVDATGLEGTMSSSAPEPEENFAGLNFSDNVRFNVTHESPGPNQLANDLQLGPDNVSLYNDAANDTYFIGVDMNGVEASDGEDYQANFTVFENGLADDHEIVVSNFSTVEADAEFDTEEVDGDDYVVVSPSGNQSITGETNLAPGTELTAFMQASGGDTPFLITPDTEVQSDGSFEATTNEFDGRSVGSEFDAEIRIDNSALGDEYDGVIQEATETDTPGDGTDTPGDGTDTPGDMTDEPGDDTPTPTEEPTPGFGIAVSLIALIGAALLAARRYN